MLYLQLNHLLSLRSFDRNMQLEGVKYVLRFTASGLSILKRLSIYEKFSFLSYLTHQRKFSRAASPSTVR